MTARVTFRAVMAATAAEFGLTVPDLLVRTRRHRETHPRQVAMTLCRELRGASFPAIGRAFGRDHTTVLHAERAVAARMTPDLAAAMDRIRARVLGRPDLAEGAP